MPLNSREKRELEKQFRRLNSKVCLLKEEDIDIQAELDLKADLVGGVVPTNQLPITQDIINALNNANTPNSTNYFTTLADLSSITPGTLINVATNFSALPAASTVPGEFYWVENAQGTSWLPGPLGGTYYSNGLYYSNGTNWVYTDIPYNATQLEVDGGLNNNKFVTPLTLNNASKWATKQDNVTLTTTGTSGAATLVGSTLNIPQYQAALTNPVTGTGVAGQVSYWSGTGTQAGSADFTWNDTTKILSFSNGGTLINEIRVGSINTNTIMGRLAGSSASLSGGSNSFFGQNSALNNTTGSSNSFFGQNAALNNTTGSANSFFGQSAGRNNTTGSNNSFFGQQAGRLIANGLNLTVADNSVFLGFDTRAAADNQTNQTVIGYQAIGLGSNTTVIGNSSTTLTWLGGSTSIGTTTSSARLHVRGSGTTSSTTALLVQNSTPSELFKLLDNGAWNFNGDGIVKGSGNTSGTNALTLQNSDGTNMWRFRNNGELLIGSTNNVDIRPGDGTIGATTLNGNGLQFNFGFTSQSGFGLITRSTGASQRTNTSGDAGIFDMFHGFAPTSGTGVFTMLRLRGDINQTGGANGITRGLYVNPTLTAAADWRSIEFSNNTGWGLYGAGTANNYLGGRLGVGTTTLLNATIRNDLNISGGSTSYGYLALQTVQSNVTASARIFHTEISTQAASFTLTNLQHFIAVQGTFGLGSTVINQYGFNVRPSLTGATNNYGFYGDIASGTGRWNLYMNGTAANYLAGDTSIGTTTSSARLHVRGSGTTSSTTALLVQNSTPSALLTVGDDGRISFGSSASSVQVYPSNVSDNTLISGDSLTFNVRGNINSTTHGGVTFSGDTSVITSGTHNVVAITKPFSPSSGTAAFRYLSISPTINQTGGANGITRGLYVNPTLTAAADWRSVEFSNNTGWGLYGAGTANNYMAGSLGIGSTSLAGYNLFVQKTLTGLANNVFSIFQNSSVQSDVTGTANGIGSYTGISGTTALGTLRHFVAAQGTFAGGGTVTTQIGYSAATTLTGATNNYGFYGDIASGTGRWNLYMNGTAANYLAGNTSIGTTTSSGRLTVQGSGTTSSTKALVVNNSTPTAIFEILDNGRINQTIQGTTANTIFGSGAGASASLSGSNNTFFGEAAGQAVTTAGGNTLIGQVAGGTLTTGGSNVYIGRSAGGSNQTAVTNTAVGTFIFLNHTTGDNNIGQGFNAARFYADGTTSATSFSGGVYFGAGSKVSAAGVTNEIVIGFNAIGNGSNTATLGSTSITNTYLRGNINYTDGGNFVIGTTTGTKIGTATSQKIGLWNATPIVQPTTGVAAATRVGGGGTTVTDTDTFDGYTIAQLVKALRNMGALA